MRWQLEGRMLLIDMPELDGLELIQLAAVTSFTSDGESRFV